MLFRSTGWLSFLVFILSLFFFGQPADSQTGLNKLSSKQKEWRVIDGFRSARFGMTEKQVLRAIAKDFKVSGNQIEREISRTEKTRSLTMHTEQLLEKGGAADIVYILGYKSKKLIQVNIDWGKGVSDNFNPDEVLSVANRLRQYFIKKRYKEEGYATNARLSDTSLIVFRGLDEQGRMILLNFVTPDSNEGTLKNAKKNVSLILSYIENAEKPDIFSSKSQ
jgi:hypothetical protein